MVRATLVLALGCTLTAATARAGTCRVDAYTPGAVAATLTAALPQVGVALLPRTVLGFPLPAGQVTLARAGEVIGTLYYAPDPRAGHDLLRITDGAEAMLLEMTDVRTVCLPPPGLDGPAGLCRQIALSTELQPPINGMPAFLLQLPPDDNEYATYLRYGEPVDYYTWSTAFATAIAWARDTLATTTVGTGPVLYTPVQRLYWALASDPEVAPYAAGLTITVGADRLWIHGVVPSDYIYGRVLDLARDAGFPYAGPDLIIDTRTQIVPAPPHCL